MFPEIFIELESFVCGTSLTLVGAGAFTGRVTTFKLRPELFEELKLILVSTPKLPIANVLLFRAFN